MGASPARADATVVVVGGGFAGVACAKQLARHGVQRPAARSPRLQPVPTAAVPGRDGAGGRRRTWPGRCARCSPSVTGSHVSMALVTAVDPAAKTVTSADGITFTGDYLVLAMGTEPNFFDTPGAEEHAFPLYSVDDAERLRSRLLTVFEDAYRNPKPDRPGCDELRDRRRRRDRRGDRGCARRRDQPPDSGPGARREARPSRDPSRRSCARSCSRPSPSTRTRTRRQVLEQRGREARAGGEGRRGRARSGRALRRSGDPHPHGRVGRRDQSGRARGALGASPGARAADSRSAPTSRCRRSRACTPSATWPTRSAPDGKPFPQLGSVALQAGRCAADNILADIDGKPRSTFHYRDKGIMAMIGRNAAIAEVGPTPPRAARRARVRVLARRARLRCSAASASGSTRSGPGHGTTSPTTRSSAIINRPDAAHIDWGE